MDDELLFPQIAGERKFLYYPERVGFWRRLWHRIRGTEPERSYFFGTALFNLETPED